MPPDQDSRATSRCHASEPTPGAVVPGRAAAGDDGFALDAGGWFPIDVDVPAARFEFQPLALEAIEAATFMDNRMALPPGPPRARPAQAIADAGFEAGRVAWLFHTSFCCSTLLARVLHAPPHQVSLKEPLVLRRLGDARFEGASIDAVLEPATRLLARPWHPGGAVLVKPTHAALNVAADLVASRPGSKAVVLTSSLEDFILSHFKKEEDTLRRIPLLAERAFRATTLHARLPRSAFEPPGVLAAAVLQWAAQREVCLDLVEAAGPETVRVLDASDLLSDLPGASVRVARWLGLPAPREVVEQRAAAMGRTHAKAIGHDYGPAHRATEIAKLRAQYADAVEQALQWFERSVRPAMRPDALAFADRRLP